MFCRNCGTKLEDGVSFCPQCGSKVEQRPINNSSKDMSFDSVVKPYVKNNKRKVIIAVVVLIVVGVAVVNIPKLAKKIAVQQEINKTENAIETALDNIMGVEDFSCRIETDASTYSKVGRNQVNGGYFVDADVTFKDGRMHAEDGRCYILFTTENNFQPFEDYTFESYITEHNQAFTAKNDESFERVNTGFSKDDLISFFEEVKANYKAKMEYKSDEESDDIIIRGTLTDGYEIYHTYIDFLNLAVAEPENYPISSEMNYTLTISKENKTVKSIMFYLPDVEHIWLGYGDDELVVENSNAEFTITYNELSEVEDFELPYFAQEEEKVFDEMEDWRKVYVSAIDNGEVLAFDYGHYGLYDLNNDGIPELLCDEERNTAAYTIVNSEIKQLIYASNIFYVADNLVLSNGVYEMLAFRVGSADVEEVFNATYDIEKDVYTYNGNTLSYQECLCELEKVTGVAFDSMLEIELNYNLDSIKEHIENYNSSSSEETTTYVLSDEYYGNILTTTEFTLDGSQLIMKDEESGIDINLKVADDCLWQYCYIQECFDSSYQDMYEVWAKFPHYNIEKLDEWGYEWSNKSIKITVKNGEIVGIVFDIGEYNEEDLEEMLSYYWEAVNSN